jgi:hypothetical protein
VSWFCVFFYHFVKRPLANLFMTVIFDKRVERAESGFNKQEYVGKAGVAVIPPCDYINVYPKKGRVVIPEGTVGRLGFASGMCVALAPQNDNAQRWALVLDPIAGGNVLTEEVGKDGKVRLVFVDEVMVEAFAARLEIDGVGAKVMIELTPIEQPNDSLAYLVMGAERFGYFN